MWRIYDYKGVEKTVVHEVEYEGNHGGTRTLTCSISSPMPIAWEVTDLITYRDENFYLRHIPQAKKQARKGMHKEAFVYDNIVFYSAIDELASCDFLDVVKGDGNVHYSALPNFSFYCETIDDIADRLQANLDRLYTGSKKWTIIVNRDPLAKTYIKPQALSFSAEKCSQVLERIYNDLGVTYEHTNRTITFGAMPIVMPYEFQYGKGKGLKSIEQSGADDNALVTRARVYGSTRNMPNRYYNKLYRNVGTTDVFYFKEPPEGVGVLWFPLISETMYVPNLMLPSFRENGKDAYIDATDAIAKYGLREGTKFFDSDNGEDEEIYPTIENMTADRLKELGYTPQLTDADNGNLDELLMVDDVPFSGVMPESGNLPSSEAHFVVYLKDIGFNLNGYLAGTPKISFRSGALAGREFDIVKCEKITLLGISYKLTCKRVEDTSIQLVFPYKDYKPSAGDKFVLLDIDMPEIYIKVAELRLKEEGEKWLELNSNPIYTYTPEIDSINILRNPKIAENLKEGNSFIFADDDLGISKAIRISNLKIKDNGFAPEYEITLSDKHTASLAEKVTQSVVDMIGTSNASVSNIKSLIEAYGNNLFLSKKKRDTADQVIRFTLGLEVGDENATIDASGNLTAKSIKSEWIGTPDFKQNSLLGTGGAMYQLNGATYAEFDYLTARKGATFAELIIQEYRSIGGALVISQANGEIESVYDYGNGYNIWLKDDDRGDSLFANKDLVRCQYWDRAKNELVYYWTPVSVGADLQGRYVLTIYKKDMNGVVPQVGDKLVQMGNTTDTSRQGCILLSTENSLPRMAILDGINSTILSNANYKAIYGSLDGFTDPYTDKELSGYGLWGDNVYLHGEFVLDNGKTVADSLKDVGNGRNLLLRTNNGTQNWSLGTSLYSDYLVSEGDLYNGYKGVHFKRLKITENAQWEIFKYVLRPEYIEKGKSYHISFDIRQGLADSTPVKLNFAICTGNGTDYLTDSIGNAVKINKLGEWQHCDIEFTPHTTGKKDDKQVIYFSASNDTLNHWTSIQIVNLKLEQGIEATEWSQAPEDIEQTMTEFKVTTEGLSSRVSTTEGKVTQIEQDANSISLKVDSINDGLEATGINITDGNIVAKTQNFEIQNQNGNTTARINADGLIEGTSGFATTYPLAGAPAPHINKLDEKLTFYHMSGNKALEIGIDNNTNSFIRVYDENGNMTWKLGTEAKFLTDETVVTYSPLNLIAYDNVAEIPEPEAGQNLTEGAKNYYKEQSVLDTNGIIRLEPSTNSSSIPDGFYALAGYPTPVRVPASNGGIELKYRRTYYRMQDGKIAMTSFKGYLDKIE